MVNATYIHCRRVFGRTPRRYGPARQIPASTTNHVLGDFNTAALFYLVSDDKTSLQVFGGSRRSWIAAERDVCTPEDSHRAPYT
jgi:hypothetical protein